MRDDLKNICILLAMILAAMITVSVLCGGCQRERKVWGQGEPPAEYTDFFGNDNMARLNFVQTERFNALNQNLVEFAKENAEQHKMLAEADVYFHERLKVLEAVDPNDYRGPQGPPGEDCRSDSSWIELISDSCGKAKDEPCGWSLAWCSVHDGL